MTRRQLACLGSGVGPDSLISFPVAHGSFEALERGDGFGDTPGGSGSGWGISPGGGRTIATSSKGAWQCLLCVVFDDFEAAVINAACRMRP